MSGSYPHMHDSYGQRNKNAEKGKQTANSWIPSQSGLNNSQEWNDRPASRSHHNSHMPGPSTISRSGHQHLARPGTYQNRSGGGVPQSSNQYSNESGPGPGQGSSSDPMHAHQHVPHRPSTQQQQQQQQYTFQHAQHNWPSESGTDHSEDVAGFFKAAGLFISSDNASADPYSSAGGMRPPPAGMRGALSWGVGPNAYESDGRPGTRGGREYDLDGRPVTRGGQRPPSRMQLGLSGVSPGSTGQTQQQQQQPLTYAAAAASNLTLAQAKEIQPSNYHHPQIQYSPGTAGPGLGSTARGASRQHADRRAMQQSTAGQKSQQSSQHHPQQQPAYQIPRSLPAAAPSGGGSRMGARGVPGGGGKGAGMVNAARSQAMSSSMFMVEEEEADVDAFVDGLSGDESDGTNMDDLKDYLKALDQDNKPQPTGPGRGASRPSAAVSSPSTTPKSPSQLRKPAYQGGDGAFQEQQQPQRQLSPSAAKHRKVVQAAHRLVDKLIDQAVRTAEVNRIVREAQDKQAAEDAKHPSLSGPALEQSLRCVLSQTQDDFSALVSVVNKSGSRIPSTQQQQQSQQSHQSMSGPMKPSLPMYLSDDFRHLPTLTTTSTVTSPGGLQTRQHNVGGGGGGGGALDTQFKVQHGSLATKSAPSPARGVVPGTTFPVGSAAEGMSRPTMRATESTQHSVGMMRYGRAGV